MPPNIEGYTRYKHPLTGRTTYYRGGSGNPTFDAFEALFTADRLSGRLVSMIILTPQFTIHSAQWGFDLLGSRGGVIFGVTGFFLGLAVGYVLAERFLRFLGYTIIVGVVSLTLYIVFSMLAQYW